MLSYRDNPNLPFKKVVTFSGETEYRNNCWKIKGSYYIIDKDAFIVEGVRYRLSSGLIIFDHELLKMVKNTKNLIKGVVGFDVNSRPILGAFSKNPYNNCKIGLNDMSNYVSINSDILIQNGFAENFSTGIWYKLQKNVKNEFQIPKNVMDHTVKGYNIEDNELEFVEKTELYKNYQPELTKDVRRYGKMLGDTTFGAEFECSKGFLPEYIQNRTGVIICRDGSLNDENGKPGPEFVTIPLSGAKGLQTLSDISKELSKRTTLNINCSFHIHFGTLPTTRMYIISLYKLAYKIQNELFLMFPFYKSNPQGIKQKNYNKKLMSLDILNVPRGCTKEGFSEYIDNAYKVLFSWLAEGCQPDNVYNRKNLQHPVQQKWNRKSRYYWINFMNVLFSKRNTVEFRLHTATTNQQKIINWVFICNAILKYNNLHSSRILLSKDNITMDEVLDYYGETFGTKGRFLSEYLKEYVKSRTKSFIEDIDKGDFISDWDLTNDKTYQFSYNNTTHLF